MPEIIRADQVAGPLIGVRRGLNLATIDDQAIICTPKRYTISRIVVTNASATPSLAVGGIYTAIGKLGTVIVPSSQVYSALSTPTRYINTALGGTTNTDTFTASVLYFSLTTPEGSGVTADLYIFGDAVEP